MSPQDAVKFMKANKIVALRLPDGLEITLMPDAMLPEAPPPAPDVGEADLDEVGSTGMSRRAQMDLLGQVFEADFAKKG